ncbi:MAG: DMT family transporter, partial [Pseudomonadota bacterium]|nr:DMT family transporter [Pseudomonadota bacterium]
MPDTLRAIILMVAGSFFFALGDMFMKLASQTVPLGQVVVTLGLGLMVFFAVLVRRDGQRLFEHRLLHHAMAMRCIGEAVAIVGVPIALRFSPMATVSALMQSLPLVLTLMAVVFLREPLRWRRSIALIVGFLGVLVIIRPGLDTFDFFAAFTLLGVLGMA